MKTLFGIGRAMFSASLFGMTAEWVVKELTGHWSQHPWNYLPVLLLFGCFREFTSFIEKEGGL